MLTALRCANAYFITFLPSVPVLMPSPGVRYFMIKSWNHENVTQSMHDGLWATQTKNEKALTEAYYSARHVILCFSVNKSMAFQGYVSPVPITLISVYHTS